MAFVSCFSTAKADASNLTTVRLTSMTKIYFVIVVDLTNLFKILITRRCLFLSIYFLLIAVFAFGIAVSGAIERVIIRGIGTRFSLTGSQSPNRTFFSMADFFSFSMSRYNIRLTGLFKSSAMSFGLSFQATRIPVLIGSSKDVYSLFSFIEH